MRGLLLVPASRWPAGMPTSLYPRRTPRLLENESLASTILASIITWRTGMSILAMSLRTSSSRLEEVRKLIAKIDIPVRQVMIEARIVEASDSFSKSLGVRLGYNEVGIPAGHRLAGTNNNPRIAYGGSLG